MKSYHWLHTQEDKFKVNIINLHNVSHVHIWSPKSVTISLARARITKSSMPWISDCSHLKLRDIVTNPRHNSNAVLAKPLLKFCVPIPLKIMSVCHGSGIHTLRHPEYYVRLYSRSPVHGYISRGLHNLFARRMPVSCYISLSADTTRKSLRYAPAHGDGYRTVKCFISVFLTHWYQDKMADVFQTTTSNAFPWTKKYEFWL